MPTLPIWHIRPATAADHALAERLASRLLVGTAAWRDREALHATFRTWLLENIAAQGDKGAAFVAESPLGTTVGIVTVSASQHFTGEQQAEIGELAVFEDAEGQGVGSALLAAAEQWAREHGYRFVSLGTGAANTHARTYYAHHGFREEDIRLTKEL
jgi:ribosomal protein S18 acetylase RimI-like enzyme